MKQLIEKSKKLTELLIELEQSKEAEKYQYVIKHEYTECHVGYYSLFDRATNKTIIDKFERIKSWLKIRNIDESKTYKWQY